MIAVLDRKILTMGKKKTGKATGRARDTGKAIPFNLELPPHIDSAVEQYKLRMGASKKWVVVKALEEFFERNGFGEGFQKVPKAEE